LNITKSKEIKTTQMRYKLLVTDGESSHNLFVTLQLNSYLDQEKINKFSIVAITNYQVTAIKDDVS
jgi:hypothetical protein